MATHRLTVMWHDKTIRTAMQRLLACLNTEDSAANDVHEINGKRITAMDLWCLVDTARAVLGGDQSVCTSEASEAAGVPTSGSPTGTVPDTGSQPDAGSVADSELRDRIVTALMDVSEARQSGPSPVEAGEDSDDYDGEVPLTREQLVQMLHFVNPTHAADAVLAVVAPVLAAREARLTESLRNEEAMIKDRDRAENWADRLAYAIAPQSEIGEHSSANNPWANALEIGQRLRAELNLAVATRQQYAEERDAAEIRANNLRAELSALRSRGIVLPEVGADRIVETVTAAINVGDSVRQSVKDLLAVWSGPVTEATEQGDEGPLVEAPGFGVTNREYWNASDVRAYEEHEKHKDPQGGCGYCPDVEDVERLTSPATPTEPRAWREGDIALDKTNFIWRRFESGWRTYPRERGVQYGDAHLEHHGGPLLRLARVPDETDQLGAIPADKAKRLRRLAEVEDQTGGEP